MEGEDEESDNPRAFNRKKPWQKALIAFCGPLMNVVLAVVLMCVIVFVVGSATTKVATIMDESNAAKDGLKVGDEIVRINDYKVDEWNDVSAALEGAKAGDEATIIVMRDGKKKTINTSLYEAEGRAMIGITPTMERNVGSSLVKGIKNTWDSTIQMYSVLKQLFTGEVSAKELSGPVGIIYMVNESATQGIVYFLYLMAILSLNLAIINLLPLPALDGGRILLIGIKKITGKAITDELEGKINTIGLLFLLMLMVYVTWNDILRFIVPIFK